MLILSGQPTRAKQFLFLSSHQLLSRWLSWIKEDKLSLAHKDEITTLVAYLIWILGRRPRWDQMFSIFVTARLVLIVIGGVNQGHWTVNPVWRHRCIGPTVCRSTPLVYTFVVHVNVPYHQKCLASEGCLTVRTNIQRPLQWIIILAQFKQSYCLHKGTHLLLNVLSDTLCKSLRAKEELVKLSLEKIQSSPGGKQRLTTNIHW